MNQGNRFGKSAGSVACFLAVWVCLALVTSSFAKADAIAYMTTSADEFGTKAYTFASGEINIL